MDADLPTSIPKEVEMKGISEKMEALQLPEEEGGGGGDHNGPIVMIIVGMAGSGKTTLTQRLTAECIRRKSPPYIINLDPACNDPPYPVNIDIRDTVKYKKVMDVYNLGPNGAIVTSLNLFATKFNQVLGLIQEKKKTHQYVIIDTPGQIEVFMWSASGSIITESLAAMFPTVLIYVTDLITNQNPITFISNMTYACSILYKTKLPLVLTLNKRDQVDPTYAKNWITDFESYQQVLKDREDYATNLASSLSLSLEEFYKNIEYTIVSATDGYGMDDFFNNIQKAVKDYETVYRPMYEKMVQERKLASEKKKAKQMQKLKQDLESGEDGEPSCFIRSGVDAGQGLSLRLGDDDDDTSSEDEQVPDEQQSNEQQSFSQLFDEETTKRKDKANDPTKK